MELLGLGILVLLILGAVLYAATRDVSLSLLHCGPAGTSVSRRSRGATAH
jgi:hypothetical protein